MNNIGPILQNIERKRKQLENEKDQTKSIDSNINYIYNEVQNGWVCPKCGRVYSPLTKECTHCNNKESEITFSSTAIPK